MGEHQYVNVYNLIIVSLSSEEKQQQSFLPATIYGEKMEDTKQITVIVAG